MGRFVSDTGTNGVTMAGYLGRIYRRPLFLKALAIVAVFLLGVFLPASDAAAQAQVQGASSHHEKLVQLYNLVAATPFVYSRNEVDDYGHKALLLSGDARIYALWRVLYAYKNDQNEAKLMQWHDLISAQAQKEGDSNLDLLARFMAQAYQNEVHGFTAFTDREWATYLATPDNALENIVSVEKVRQLQQFQQWADAIDISNSLIANLQAEGPQAAGVLTVAQQIAAYTLVAVGDYDGYADHLLAMARLSRQNSFFSQKMDMVYDLAFWASQENDTVIAEKFQKIHADNVRKYTVEDLKTWDEFLCASIESQGKKYQRVLDCLQDSVVMNGPVNNSIDYQKLKLLTKAYAYMGNIERTKFYLAKIRAVPSSVSAPEKLFEQHIEAFVLKGEGRPAEGFTKLDDWAQAIGVHQDAARVASVQGMYKALRKELDRKTAESILLNKQVQMRTLLLGAAALISVLLAIIVLGGAVWVIRMRRMQWNLRDAHEHAEAANAAKSRFLAVMSHELRTPLNGVLGMAQALKKEDLSEAQQEQVKILVDSGETLLVLLNDVLDLSRIEAGRVELAPTPTTVKDMIERVINTYSALVADKHVSLRYELDESATPVMTFDILRVYQCLSNLVSNALKFTESGMVRILASAQPRVGGGYLVRIEVRDTGIGMAQATLDKLFEAYSQADALTARHYGGSGLGLNISRSLAELMGGSLSVTSEVGVGSAFVITFEAGEALHQGHRNESTQTVEAHAVEPELPGMNILLVDDHPVNRKVVRLFLEPFGFVITEAVDGQEALDLDMSRFDMILMDLNMPRLGGLEATRIFRASEAEGKHVPIVALTADAMKDQIDACYAAGMDAHISKPILMDSLIDTVTRLLRIQAPEATRAVAAVS